jgi:ubiquinone/menaquinone biosynthesis C-methylase UbiE
MRMTLGYRNDLDAYGHELWDYYTKRRGRETMERDDGLIDPSETSPQLYFAKFKDWEPVERQAMRYAWGRVLDVGCGAGRVSLYLQEKGLKVLGIDNSPLALKVSKSRGVKKVKLIPFQKINFKPNSFDTVIMYGNNFGLFGSKLRAKQLLKKLHRMTSPRAVLICESLDPYKTSDPLHLAYQKSNRARGRMSGQVRIRARYRAYVGKWFDYLLVSPEEMREIVEGTGWRIERFISSEKIPLNIGIVQKQTQRPTWG